MKQLTAANIKAIEGVRDAILAEPEMYNQMNFYTRKHPCQSACCIAGWAVFNESRSNFADFAKRDDWDGLCMKADSLFGLRASQGRFTLFSNPDDWPEPFRSDYGRGTQLQRAVVAASLLDAIIATDGEVLNG